MNFLKISSALLAFGISAGALANPLIIKTNFSGYTPEEWVRTEVCTVFIDRVAIKRTYGRVGTENHFVETKEVPIQLSDGIYKVLDKASADQVEETPNGLCDGPHTGIRAYNNRSELLLFSTGGCGTPRKLRQGGTSDMLMSLVKQYCPKTFDIR